MIFLLQEPVLVTFLILAGGLLLGQLKYKGFSPGSAGVFLVGFAAGMLGIVSSDYVTELGFILFMYALGIQGGPIFFNSLGRKGIPYLVVALTVSLSAIFGSLAAGKIFNLGPETILGVYTGSLAHSSSLVMLLEGGWSGALLSSYGIVYPLGFISVILFVQLAPRLLKKDLNTECRLLLQKRKAGETHLNDRKFTVENPEVQGKSLCDLNFRCSTGATLSRLRRNGHILIPSKDTKLKLGDVVLAVGTDEALEKVHQMLGNETHNDMEMNQSIKARRVVISNPIINHTPIANLNIRKQYNAVITRVWRGGIELSPTGTLLLERGDTVVVVGNSKRLEKLVQFLSPRGAALGEFDLFSMAFGIAAGMILGKASIPIWGIGEIRMGDTGGALLVGMILGNVRRFGILTSHMSNAAESVLKELGLGLLLAGIGTRAGAGISELELMSVLKMLAASGCVVILCMTMILAVSYYVLKMDLISSLACVCGGMNNSAALATLTKTIDSEEPATTFAACYPLTLFGIILSSQILSLMVR